MDKYAGISRLVGQFDAESRARALAAVRSAKSPQKRAKAERLEATRKKLDPAREPRRKTRRAKIEPLAEDRRVRYGEYIQSDAWKIKRMERIVLDGGRCADCGTTKSLHVHHLHYGTLGRERMKDLITVCYSCHEIRHGATLHNETRPSETSQLSRNRPAPSPTGDVTPKIPTSLARECAQRYQNPRTGQIVAVTMCPPMWASGATRYGSRKRNRLSS